MKNLKNLLLISGIAGIIGSCAVNKSAEVSVTSVYNTKINEDSIKFIKDFTKKNIVNIIEVKKPNNKIIIYRDDMNSDYIIESIEVIENGNSRFFHNSSKIEKPVVDEAQKQFDQYLQKINDPKIILK